MYCHYCMCLLAVMEFLCCLLQQEMSPLKDFMHKNTNLQGICEFPQFGGFMLDWEGRLYQSPSSVSLIITVNRKNLNITASKWGQGDGGRQNKTGGRKQIRVMWEEWDSLHRTGESCCMLTVAEREETGKQWRPEATSAWSHTTTWLAGAHSAAGC